MAEEAGFDVLLTKDKNMCYQLNLEGRKIAVIAFSNALWPFVKPMLRQVVSAGRKTMVEIKVC